MATIHIAGEPQLGGLYQGCARCGHTLQDYTGNPPMVIEGQDPTIPTWPEGQRIAIDGGTTWVMSNTAELDSHQTECRGTS